VFPSVEWFAFPLTALATDEQIDAARFSSQDEYVEWRVERGGGPPTRVTFTTEFPEYFEAFAAIGVDALVDAIRDVVPGAAPSIADLFGPAFDPTGPDAMVRAEVFRANLRNNPWNNGARGILCLTQGANTLGALFNLVTECGIPKTQGSPQDTCSFVGGACGPGRSSDPNVCATAQQAVRDNFGFSLTDPAGVRIVALEGSWAVGNTALDINDATQNQAIWTVSRNRRRGVLTVVPGLRLDGHPIVTGAQVSRKLRVAANLIAAPDGTLPSWARRGNESDSRGPEA
jgi:hypothetical protein